MNYTSFLRARTRQHSEIRLLLIPRITYPMLSASLLGPPARGMVERGNEGEDKDGIGKRSDEGKGRGGAREEKGGGWKNAGKVEVEKGMG